MGAWEGLGTCLETRSIVRSINGAGQGRSSGTERSATQKRVRSWWSMEADSGVWRADCLSTEARMSSMSILRVDWMEGYGGADVQYIQYRSDRGWRIAKAVRETAADLGGVALA